MTIGDDGSTTTTDGGGDGTIGFVVWPTYVGVVMGNGDEPLFELDYQRGQINWAVNGNGELHGSATIQVPAGEWCWVIYCYNQFRPGYITAQKLAQPLILDKPGKIEMHEITEEDVKPLAPDPILHD